MFQIGSGSAGSVIASRLSEEKSFRVLLLEAGGPADVITDMPAKEKTLKGGIFDWEFLTTPQKHAAFGFNQNKVPHERGKVLGGTSVVNNMNYLRGLPEDYNKWAQLVQDGEWSWDGVLPYFLKAESNTDPEILANGLHNDKGMVNYITPPRTMLIDSFINATLELGFPKINDLNGPHFGQGAAYLQKNIKSGARISTASGYLKPFYKDRPNLHIIAKSFVTKIIFGTSEDKDNKVHMPRAIGVQFNKDDQSHTVYVTKEIIVSAGSFNSAKLLMLSGIGPKYELEKFGIPLVADLPVGVNYHEAVCLFDGIHFTTNQNFSLPESFTYEEFLDYFVHGTGPLTLNTHASLRRVDSFGKIVTMRFVGGSKADDFSNGQISETIENMRRDVWNQFYKPYAGKYTITGWVIMHHPKSRGCVKLKSRDPYEMPYINPNFLSDPADVDAVVDSILLFYKLIQTAPFRKLNAKPFETVIPGCEKYYQRTYFNVPPTSYLKCLARTFTNHCSDPISTCRMGTKESEEAVVDSRLRVIGVDGLRVADSSVIPLTFSGHTHTASAMIGEKASDIIKNDWLSKSVICNELSDDSHEIDRMICEHEER